MFNLKKKVKEQKESAEKQKSAGCLQNKTGRISVRDKLLTQEVQDVSRDLPHGCELTFPDPDELHIMTLSVRPPTGYWANGIFLFQIEIPPEYNMLPPCVKCTTRLWHPNITESGEVCLSILRSTSLDSTGWAPVRTLKDVVWGLSALFGDLVNFDDPLNLTAAEEYSKNQEAFIRKVKQYIYRYSSS